MVSQIIIKVILLVAFALLAVLGILGVPVTTPVIVGCILLVVTIAAVIGLLGHATIMWIQKWLTWIFGALTPASRRSPPAGRLSLIHI